MSFPAGIEVGFEIYKHNHDLRVLNDGERTDYVNLPASTRYIFKTEMCQDPKAIWGLKRMGYSDPEEMELKFVSCRYGALNSSPDMVGITTKPDAPNCGEEMTRCPGFGCVCRIPDQLSRREYLIAQLIGKGKLDKEICNMFHITIATCRTFQNRIHNKLHLNNRVEVAYWAQNLEIV